ncbi:MAG: glycosyltransferase [Anaerolineaceae bacterium]
MLTPNKIPRLLFLYSDTGGGHRSAVEAIMEALQLEFPQQYQAEMVDFFKEYAPAPLNFAPEIYPVVSKSPRLWGINYRLMDGKRQVALMMRAASPYYYMAVRRMLSEHPSDLVVSVHPLMNTPIRQVVHRKHIPFTTVVTDMVSTHALWFDYKADLILLPTEIARARGLELGIAPERMQVCGLPVADVFCKASASKSDLRKKLDWEENCLTLLLVGGGEGMGPLEATAAALNASGLPISLVMITGRNQRLKDRLESRDWQIPHHVYGFVSNMPDLMRAADVLITKAGPGTISEAFISGLPIILYNRQPGQEEGNVLYVIGEGAGMWAPEPAMVVSLVKNWINHPDRLAETTQASLSLARPDAARQIARLLMKQAA